MVRRLCRIGIGSRRLRDAVKHPVNGKLYSIVRDEYAMGVLWMASPIVIIDTYEHAYYVDYQNRKAEHVEKFMSHIDWNEADQRWKSI